MSGTRRVIGAETIEQARAHGRLVVEVLADDIVTALAAESAARLGIKLVAGPLERPAVVQSDAATATRRALFRRSPGWIAPQQVKATRSHKIRQLAVIGAGGVGANIAHLAVLQNLADGVTLIDIVPGLAASIALDINHAGGISRSNTVVTGTTDITGAAGADIVIVTAGRPRTPGMSRSDLISINRKVIQTSADAIKTHAPDAIVIVVTNPLDEMTHEMLRSSGFPRERVLGMAGTLDSSRFRYALAREANVELADVEAITLGSHGDEMAPIISKARIKGRPLNVFLSEEAIERCANDAVSGGGQVVALRKTGSASIAPAHSVTELLDHIRGAKAGSVPVSVMLEGEFDISGVVLGVPCHLGSTGLIEVDEITLEPAELGALHAAADAIRQRLAG